jgi:hypothetical protein
LGLFLGLFWAVSLALGDVSFGLFFDLFWFVFGSVLAVFVCVGCFLGVFVCLWMFFTVLGCF